MSSCVQLNQPYLVFNNYIIDLEEILMNTHNQVLEDLKNETTCDKIKTIFHAFIDRIPEDQFKDLIKHMKGYDSLDPFVKIQTYTEISEHILNKSLKFPDQVINRLYGVVLTTDTLGKQFLQFETTNQVRNFFIELATQNLKQPFCDKIKQDAQARLLLNQQPDGLFRQLSSEPMPIPPSPKSSLVRCVSITTPKSLIAVHLNSMGSRPSSINKPSSRISSPKANLANSNPLEITKESTFSSPTTKPSGLSLGLKKPDHTATGIGK